MNPQSDNPEHPTHHFLHLIGIPASILAGILFIGTIYWLYGHYQGTPSDGVACIQDAMQCPDGSYVGRTGPNCEFAECPTTKQALTGDECVAKGGKIINTLGFEEWNQEDYIADVTGMRCPCICVKDTAQMDTPNWQTYRNEEYGFEFRYPPFWIKRTEWGAIAPRETPDDCFYPTESIKNDCIHVNFVVYEGNGFRYYLKGKEEVLSWDNMPTEKIGQYEFYVFEYIIEDSTSLRYVTKGLDGKYYGLAYQEQYPKMSQKSTFKEILSTFKFID